MISQGGDRWEVRIAVPQAKVASRDVFPGPGGFTFSLHYAGWQEWPRKAEWALYGGAPELLTNDRILVRDGKGTRLTGRGLPISKARRSAAMVLARDDDQGSGNQSQPVVQVRNVGGEPLRDFDLDWYVRAPVQPEVMVRYAPDATAEVSAVSGMLWRVRLRFRGKILYPGQSTREQSFLLHLPGWGAWDRSGSPTTAPSQPGLWPEGSVVLSDAESRILWGAPPVLEQAVNGETMPPEQDTTATVVATPQVDVQIRDENPGDLTWIRPRLLVKNTGTQVLTRLDLELPLVLDAGKEVEIANWYAPNCRTSLLRDSETQGRLRYECTGLSLQPGEILPNLGGAVVGVRYLDGSLWNRQEDPFVRTWTTDFQPTTTIVVKALP